MARALGVHDNRVALRTVYVPSRLVEIELLPFAWFASSNAGEVQTHTRARACSHAPTHTHLYARTRAHTHTHAHT